MGCIYACTCDGSCYKCLDYMKEEYVGHAEDIYDEIYGKLRNTIQKGNKNNEPTKKDI